MIAVAASRARGRGHYTPSADLLPAVLAGSRNAVARMISRAEKGLPEAAETLAEIYRRGGGAHIIGITGVLGSGKSTLVAALIAAFAARGAKVGVVAIDPSSPFSGGAILGDRVRMSDAITANGAFVRSMATRGALGGLSRSTLQAVDVLDAAGYSPIILETVGVGQDEVDVVSAAHTVVVLSPPGLGDDIQAIKAGILEIADIHVVSKIDRPEASATVAALKGMMALGSRLGDATWTPPIIGVSTVSRQGIGDLVEIVVRHHRHLAEGAALEERRRDICRTRILGAARRLFQQRFDRNAGDWQAQLKDVVDRRVDPEMVARSLLGSKMEAQVR